MLDDDTSGIYLHNIDSVFTPNGMFKDLIKRQQLLVDKKYVQNSIDGYKRLKRIVLNSKSRNDLRGNDHSKIEQLRSKIRGIIINQLKYSKPSNKC